MDKLIYGFVSGIILPILTSILFYNFGYQGQLDYWGFLEGLLFIDTIGMLLAVCCLSNLALFLIIAQFDKLRFARGLFIATILYALAVVIFKFAIN